MLNIRELEKNGVDTAIDIYNTAFRDNRLKHDITTFNEEEGMELLLQSATCLDVFSLAITPLSGYYAHKKFSFEVRVPEFFPYEAYKVKCTSPIFHPNIDQEGHICLNILREDWMPSIDLNQVACSIQFLLTEPNAHDALNEEAGNLLLQNPIQFQTIVNRM